jgi:hypothetical protein
VSEPTLTEPDRPKRSANPRLKTSSTLVALPKVALGGGTRLQNLSTTGACVELQGLAEQDVVEKGRTLQIKLAHPKLNKPLTLDGEVMWTGGGGAEDKTLVGLRFHDVEGADKALRPFLTAEVGSCVFKEERLVGFVVPHGKAKKAWSLFDESGKRLAVAARDATGYEVHAKTQRAGSLPSFHTDTLCEATCQSIGLDLPLRLDPPVPEFHAAKATQAKPKEKVAEAAVEPVDGAPLEALAVNVEGTVCGYAAEVGEGMWKVFDSAEVQVAVLRKAGATCTVIWSDTRSSQDFQGGGSFKTALAAILGRSGVPTLRDTVIHPSASKTPATSEPPSREALGRSVVGPGGPLGFLCETELAHSWLVVDVEGAQIAYLSGSEGSPEFQICSMGDAIDDELEFQAFPNLRTAVAVAFQLDCSAEEVQIDGLKAVGRVTPVLVNDSASSVDLQPGAVKITLEGYPTQEEVAKPVSAKAEAEAKARAKAVAKAKAERKAKAKSKSTGTFKQEVLDRPASRLLPAVVILVSAVHVVYGIYRLVISFTS